MFIKIPAKHSVIFQLFNTDKAYVIANTYEMWPLFINWYQNNRNVMNPIDTFIQLQLKQYDNIYYSHKKYSGHFLPFQRICDLTFEPYSDLSLHPKYGPWISLRALVLGVSVDPLPLVSLSQQQVSTIQSIPNPSNWLNHVKIRKLISQFCHAEEYEFSEAQIQYHYNRILHIK